MGKTYRNEPPRMDAGELAQFDDDCRQVAKLETKRVADLRRSDRRLGPDDLRRMFRGE